MDKDTKKTMRWNTGTRTNNSANKQEILGPDYAISYACLKCKTAHKRHVNVSPNDYPITMECPICKEKMYWVGRHFKAPKKSDTAQWNKVKFLIEHGFLFQKIRLEANSYESTPYPKTLEEAKEFVIKYKEWAYKDAL